MELRLRGVNGKSLIDKKSSLLHSDYSPPHNNAVSIAKLIHIIFFAHRSSLRGFCCSI
jgi:hypothetical protein